MLVSCLADICGWEFRLPRHPLLKLANKENVFGNVWEHSSLTRSGFAKLSLIGGLLSLSAFALAGYLGDRYGRKKLGVVGILVKTAVDAWLQRQPWHALLQFTHS